MKLGWAPLKLVEEGELIRGVRWIAAVEGEVSKSAIDRVAACNPDILIGYEKKPAWYGALVT